MILPYQTFITSPATGATEISTVVSEVATEISTPASEVATEISTLANEFFQLQDFYTCKCVFLVVFIHLEMEFKISCVMFETYISRAHLLVALKKIE
jgi:hypothetical protein